MTNILNLPGLRVLDMKELDTEFHVKAEPVAVSRMCPHCGKSNNTIGHGKLPLFVRDMPTLGKSMMIHLDAPRFPSRRRLRPRRSNASRKSPWRVTCA